MTQSVNVQLVFAFPGDISIGRMRTVIEQLGHSQMSLTSNLYSHFVPAMLAENAEALERAMAGK